jgi:tripartite-type tricarboxylate transporter receptor subunit TctC
MKRTVLLAALVLIIASLAFAAGEAEADYPTNPITVICPWSAGGGTDRTARFISEQLSDVVGQPVNVVNRTGGAGAVGHQAAANAKPDGYTIGNLTFEVNTLSYLGYSEVTPEDYVPLLQFNEDAAAVIVRGDAPYDSINDLLEAIRSEPAGTFQFSGSSIGSVWDLSRIGMLDQAGIDPGRVKYIPTKGAAPAITEMLGGHVDVITCSYPEAAPQIKAGELKALAIMAQSRNPQFEDVPTLKEQGIDFAQGTWRGFALPLGTPESIAEYLRDSLLEVVESDEFVDFMANNGFGIKTRVGDEFMEFMMDQYRQLEDIFELAGYGQE